MSEVNVAKTQEALNKIGYGLYVVTCREGDFDNALIVNTVMQLTSKPFRVAVAINRANFSHDIIYRTGKMNVHCLTVDAPFTVFQTYGFVSGRDKNKFEGKRVFRSLNGLPRLTDDVSAILSLSVEQYIDLGSHGLFICSVTDTEVLSDAESMTYAYYHAHVKPKPQMKASVKGYVCKICGYVYEGETLPPDFICPVCKHGVEDFEPIPADEPKKIKGYVCKICGYVYEGETLPPDFICPVCKHGVEDFEPVFE